MERTLKSMEAIEKLIDASQIGDLEIMEEKDKSRLEQFEDDGTLFYCREGIIIYEYFGQDKAIKKSFEKQWYKAIAELFDTFYN